MPSFCVAIRDLPHYRALNEKADVAESRLINAIDALPDANGSRAALRALADFVVDRDT